MSRPAVPSKPARKPRSARAPRKVAPHRNCACPRCLFLRPEELRAITIRKEA
jgi:hypothetical protein